MPANDPRHQRSAIDRRTFLKLAGAGGVSVAAGCDPIGEKHLYSLVQAPEGMVTGQPTVLASVCRECPAGCGLLARNREGRVIKLEGNPLHPINQGRLCMRGQAALQALYHPDRLRTPVLRHADAWKPLGYDQAGALLAEKARTAATRGTGRVAMISECIGEPLAVLCRETLATWRSPAPLITEPLAFETLKHSHALVNGREGLPGYRLELADLLLSFGADFLETWLSPVEYARRFTQMHALENGRKGRFIHIGPYRTLTGANADRWLACLPGGEARVALGLMRICLAAGRGRDLPADLRQALGAAAEPFTPERVAHDSGLTPAELIRLGEVLLGAQRPVVLGTPSTCAGSASLATEAAAMALNRLLDPNLTRLDLSAHPRVECAARRAEFQAFLDMLSTGAIELLLINNTNPAFSLQPGDRFSAALQAGRPFTVCFSAFMDETAALADLVFPLRLPLESWDVYGGRSGLLATLQPTSGRLTAAPQLGDVLLAASRTPGREEPAPSYRDWLIKHLAGTAGISSAEAWERALQRGGIFAQPSAPRPQPPPGPAQVDDLHALLATVGRQTDSDALTLIAAPSLRFYDGRSANRPWLCEVPDPLTQVCWQTPLCAHPLTLARHGLQHEELARVAAGARNLEAPVFASDDVRPGVLLMALGQGRRGGGRWAADIGLDPGRLLPGEIEPLSGAPLYSVAGVSLTATGRRQRLAHTDGSRVQHGRPIALAVGLADLQPHAGPGGEHHGLGMDGFPLTLPLPEGYDARRDFYPPHDHADYRWGMAVDLDRCIGCGACAVACYAENNIGVVGVERILEGREMAWLRIERYLEGGRVAFLPMMCQHCDNAPCEAVCPVYAPHHSKEGLNNQIYNRCIGTRFCGQNCPYKVRRFNWFQWHWPEPLNLQLNPDVTVRAKGVMEKCSFCVQRIKAGHDAAKNDKRAIRDGEVVPACAQTCPTGALVFGNLLEPASRVAALVRDRRAYQVMGYLNTKPAVIYLKKVVVEV